MSEERVYTDGRLGARPADSLLKHLNSLELEYQMEALDEFIQTDLAHVVCLAEAGAIPGEAAGRILGALVHLRETDAPERELSGNPEAGGVLFQVEQYLLRECGPEGYMLHIARSRIDQDAEVMRLQARNLLISVITSLLALGDSLLAAAERYDNVVCPVYTQRQHGQPGTLGHYFNGQYWALSRGLERLIATLSRYDYCSLGGVALVGTDWPIDRKRVADLLGHQGSVPHAGDAGVFSLDINADLAAALALVLGSLGRFAGDLYFWASSEINLVAIDPSLCGTSSVMPQKRNPYALQRVRAIAGEAAGWPSVELGLLKTATTTDLDIVLSRNRAPGMCHQAVGAAELMRDVVDTLSVDVEGMGASADSQWSTASALADSLTRRGKLAFRDAHDLVGRVVRLANGRHVTDGAHLRTLLATAVADAGIEPLDRDLEVDELLQSLDVQRFVDSRTSSGGVSPDSRRALLERSTRDLESHRTTFSSATNRISRADSQLSKIAHELADRAETSSEGSG